MNPGNSSRRSQAGRLVRLLHLLCFGCLALTSGAAIPAPEQLLPDDTLILLTAPDYGKLREIWQQSPQSRLWNDPAMKPLREKLL